MTVIEVLLHHWWYPVLIVLAGALAGGLGGLLGVGGSIIMIPAMAMIFVAEREAGLNQHLFQATAMIANVAVAVPAALRHHQAGATVPQALRWLLPAAVVAVLAGVWVSNLPIFAGRAGGVWLARILAGFQVYVIYVNIRRLKHDRTETGGTPHVAPAGALGVGASMGFVAGLLGIGGGAIAVPLQQVLLRLPLRACIANSAFVMVFSAAIGATYKNVTLAEHGGHWAQALTLAVLLAPACIVGSRVGARLTHHLPLRQVRLVFIALMFAAALKMAHLPWPF